MKLCRLRIHNYRSIRDVELEVPDMLIMLGPNNHGKSNVLSALEFALSTSAKPEHEDFFSFRQPDDSELWVEMTFNDLSAQERVTFQKYLRSDQTICIRKTAKIQETGNIDVSYNGYVEEPDLWWLKSSAYDRLSSRDQVEREAEEVPELRALLEGSGRITRQRIEDFQRGYIEAHREELTFTEVLESTPLLGQRNVAGDILPEFILVPAVRDLSEEIKVKTTTVFGRLLRRTIKDMAESDPRFIDLRNRLQQLIDELNVRPESDLESVSELARLETLLASELASWGVRVSIEVSPPEIEKIFELGTQVHVDDGLKTIAERKGHGLQRALMFALLRAWVRAIRPQEEESEPLSARQASGSVLFAIEEPELFLHPHAQRQLFSVLNDIASTPGHQVFLCTHSTHFIDLEQYRRIVVITKPSPELGTQVKQCTRDLFAGTDSADRKRRFHMAAWINPDRGELFFARKVILTEGETEKATFPYLARRLNCFDPNVTVIDCGSKNNIPLYIEILNAFRIPYCVIHDEDPLPDPIPEDWSPNKKDSARKTFELNEVIASIVDSELGAVEVLAPDFEGVAGVSRSQRNKKKGKALAALDHLSSLDVTNLPERLVDVVMKAYRVADGEAPVS